MTSNTIGSQYDHIIQQTGDGFAVATLSFISQNYGRGNFNRVKKTIGLSSLIIFLFCMSLSVILLFLAYPLCKIMSDTDAVIEYAVLRIRIMSTTYFFCGLMSNYANAIKGLGKPVVAMMVSIFGSCVLRILWVYTVLQMNRTLFMLYIIWPISWCITSIMLILCLIPIYKKCKMRYEKEHKEAISSLTENDDAVMSEAAVYDSTEQINEENI